MKTRKKLAHWKFFVDAVEKNRVFLRAIRVDVENSTEEEMEFPINRYLRYFGKEHLKEGMIGQLCCYTDVYGRVKLRGWPYKRKWTEEQLKNADVEAKKLWENLATGTS